MSKSALIKVMGSRERSEACPQHIGERKGESAITRGERVLPLGFPTQLTNGLIHCNETYPASLLVKSVLPAVPSFSLESEEWCEL
jgi:hypothetical protein